MGHFTLSTSFRGIVLTILLQGLAFGCLFGVIVRLAEAGALGPRSILAHCVHLEWEELSEAQQRGAWLVHCPRSDMARSVGYASAGKFGARRALGNDGVSGDMLAEGQMTFLRGAEAGFKLDLARWHAGGQSLASELSA